MDVFRKLRLSSRQLREVARQRLGDARCLLNSGDKQRLNGAVYIAGFVIECLLKAMLVDRHPNLARPVDRAALSPSDLEAHKLLYDHRLDDMVEFLPEIASKAIAELGENRWKKLQETLAEWTIYVRYSPRKANPTEAMRFVNTVEELSKWLERL